MTLKLPNPDGSGDIIDIRSLRSPEWLVETGAEPGGWVLFGLPEIGVVGPAYVVAVEPCPPVEAGPGRVVLATVTHYNSFVLRLWVAGLDEALEPTAEHPLHSEDRQAWVAAGELQMGEQVRTLGGPLAVVRIEEQPGLHRVCNLEVEYDHCYLVADRGVVVHNGCLALIKGGWRLAGGGWRLAKAGWRRAGMRAAVDGAEHGASLIDDAARAARTGARLPAPGTAERAAIEAARSKGIRAARTAELENIRAGGKGSGVWTEAELEQIRATGEFPVDVRWHHDPTVANRPDLAADPDVVRPVRGGVRGHLDAHGGDWRK